MLALIIVIPLLGALIAFVVSSKNRPVVVAVFALAHLAIVLTLPRNATALQGWLALDALGLLVAGLVSTLFLLCASYGIGYLRVRPERPNRLFCTCLLAFLGLASLISVAQHLALMWVAMEGATLATAVLIYFNRNARSLEATWKYLIVGSVGIALALLGSLFVAYATFLTQGGESSLLFSHLLASAGKLSPPWLRAGFVLLLVGYGTKMGLAPMHTWKPDAYGEAPGIVGALMAGGMASCAFLALLRVYQIMNAAGDGPFARQLFLALGILSMAVAASFMAGQRDFKRLLAYSSVEHMGILVLGVGIGGVALLGALLHLINNALAKVILFLSAGNIHRAYGSKRIDEVSGALRRIPISGALFLIGFLAITGSPPFGPFISEFTILAGAMESHHYLTAGLFLTFLLVIFVGMGTTVFAVLQGTPPAETSPPREGMWKTFPMFVALLLITVMGIWIPRPLYTFLEETARTLQGGG